MRIASKLFFCFSLATFLVAIVAALPVIADSGSAVSYQPLESVPGFESETAGGQFPAYIQSLYKLGLWIVGISALFMFSVGAFTYLSSAGNTSAMGSGKGIMKDALMGLVLALVSWLILNTINPDLVNINFGIMDAGGGGGVGSNPDQVTTDTGTKGNCGGMNVALYAKPQCDLVSSALNGLLSCMAKNGANGIDGVGAVYSITAANVGNNLEKSKACCGSESCTHATNTCHYGCTTSEKGYSHAFDYTTRAGASDATLCKIAEIAWSCGAGNKMWGPRNIQCSKGKITYQDGHGTHLHIATSTCNH